MQINTWFVVTPIFSGYFTQMEDYDGFKIRSVLGLPIRNTDLHIIGVVQLLNKYNGKPFSETDVNICEVCVKRLHCSKCFSYMFRCVFYLS